MQILRKKRLLGDADQGVMNEDPSYFGFPGIAYQGNVSPVPANE